MRSTTPFRCALTAAALSLAGAASAQTTHEGAGAETPMTCENGEAHITGASNVIAVEGPCRLLVVEGAGNTVTVDLTAHAAIRVTGASNRITWRAPAGTTPQVSSAGAGNVIRRAR